MQRQTTTENANRQPATVPTTPCRPWLLPMLLDAQMDQLGTTERFVECGQSFEQSAQSHADMCARFADVILEGRMPKQWAVHLRSLLPGMTKSEIAEMIRASEASGNPPARFEYLVSMQITEALIRGHLPPQMRKRTTPGRPEHLLRDLLDRQMVELGARGRLAALTSDRRGEAAALADIREVAELMDQRATRVLDESIDSDYWTWELAGVLGISKQEAAEVARKSEAVGNPPTRLALAVSYQIIAAVMRGYVLAEEGNSESTRGDDPDRDDGELVCA